MIIDMYTSSLFLVRILRRTADERFSTGALATLAPSSTSGRLRSAHRTSGACLQCFFMGGNLILLTGYNKDSLCPLTAGSQCNGRLLQLGIEFFQDGGCFFSAPCMGALGRVPFSFNVAAGISCTSQMTGATSWRALLMLNRDIIRLSSTISLLLSIY